jgi:hypothetical protein
VECVRHHAVLHKPGFPLGVESSLTFGGLGEGDAGDPSLCGVERTAVAENPCPVSALAKPFPGGIGVANREPVR